MVYTQTTSRYQECDHDQEIFEDVGDYAINHLLEDDKNKEK